MRGRWRGLGERACQFGAPQERRDDTDFKRITRMEFGVAVGESA